VRAAVVSAGESIIPVLSALLQPERRAAGARDLAARFGAEDLLIFVRDREVDALLPALGFPQTLPDGARWRHFLEGCGAGRLTGELPSPHHGGRVVPASAVVAADGSIIVLLGGAPCGDCPDLKALLPLVSSALQTERAALATEGRSRVERESGRQLGALAEALDRVRLQLQLALTERTRAIESRDRVLAVVSHDVRGPLGTILLASQALRRAPSRTAPIDSIVRSAERIQRMVHDLLDLGSIEAGRLGVELRPHDPAAILREAQLSHEPLAHEKGVLLESVADGALTPLACDRDRILQVLSNLLGNAISATPPGGRILLRVGLFEPSGQGDRDLRFSVEDTGPGIGPEDLAHLFERHFRSRRAPYRGTGLGLAIAKGIVETHGGRIWAESVVGAGTRLFFTLPRDAAAVS
jgi:signal transduction histidine kinase